MKANSPNLYKAYAVLYNPSCSPNADNVVIMHANVLIIILYWKLEGFYQIACITGTLWAKRGERFILREARNECEAAYEGRRNIKCLFLYQSIVLALLPTYPSRVLIDGGDVKRTDQNTIHYSKIVTFLATRNTDNSMRHIEITARAKSP